MKLEAENEMRNAIKKRVQKKKENIRFDFRETGEKVSLLRKAGKGEGEGDSVDTRP